MFAILWFSAICVGMPWFHSPLAPVWSSMNVRARTDILSVSPWVSQLVTTHLVQIASGLPGSVSSLSPAAQPWFQSHNPPARQLPC